MGFFWYFGLITLSQNPVATGGDGASSSTTGPDFPRLRSNRGFFQPDTGTVDIGNPGPFTPGTDKGSSAERISREQLWERDEYCRSMDFLVLDDACVPAGYRGGLFEETNLIFKKDTPRMSGPQSVDQERHPWRLRGPQIRATTGTPNIQTTLLH